MTEGRGPSRCGPPSWSRIARCWQGLRQADERFEILGRIGRLQREETERQRAAQVTFEQALAAASTIPRPCTN